MEQLVNQKQELNRSRQVHQTPLTKTVVLPSHWTKVLVRSVYFTVAS